MDRKTKLFALLAALIIVGTAGAAWWFVTVWTNPGPVTSGTLVFTAETKSSTGADTDFSAQGIAPGITTDIIARSGECRTGFVLLKNSGTSMVKARGVLYQQAPGPLFTASKFKLTVNPSAYTGTPPSGLTKTGADDAVIGGAWQSSGFFDADGWVLTMPASSYAVYEVNMSLPSDASTSLQGLSETFRGMFTATQPSNPGWGE